MMVGPDHKKIPGKKNSQANNSRKRMREFMYKFFCWFSALVSVTQGLTVYLRLGFPAQSACGEGRCVPRSLLCLFVFYSLIHFNRAFTSK